MGKLINKDEHADDYNRVMGFVQKHKAAKPKSTHTQTFSGDVIKELVNDPNFGSLKIHHGVNDEGHRVLILEALDTEGLAMNKVAGDAPTCPPTCPENT